MAAPTPTPPTTYDAETAAFVTECAEADAMRVGEFLRELGLAPPPGQSRTMPAALLLDLGAAMRLLGWEEAGLDVHRQAGLPEARDALGRLLRSPAERRRRAEGDLDPTLLPAVLRLLLDRFAWAGQRQLGAEVVLDVPDDDTLVAALARFLLANRDRTDNVA